MRGTAEAFDLRAALQAELAAAQDALALSDTAQAVHRCRVSVKRARALARVGAIGAPGLAGLFNDAARALMALALSAIPVALLAASNRQVIGAVSEAEDSSNDGPHL